MATKKRYSILDNMLEGCGVISFGWRFLYVNEAGARLARRTREELLGHTIMEVFPGIEATEMFAVLRQCMEQGTPHRMENEFTLPDGTTGRFEFSIQPVPEGIFILSLDITELKRAEQELRESQEHYRLLADNITDVIYVMDLELHPAFVSPSVTRMLGYSVEEALRKSVAELVTPASLQVIMETLAGFRGASEAGQTDLFMPVTTELELLRKEGSTVWAEFRSTLLPGPDGRPAGFLGSARDITERKRAEEALHRAEENFRNSLDSLPLGVRIVNADGDTLYANQTLLDIYRYSSIDELKATPVSQRYTPESYERYQVRREKRRRGEDVPPSYEIGIVRKDGEVRHLEALRKEVLWNGKPQFQVLYSDITERKLAEEALRRSEDTYRTVFETTSTAMLMIEEDTTISLINAEFERLSGYSREEVEGKKSWATFVAKEDLPRMAEYHRLRRLDPQAVPASYECRLITREGNVLDALLTVAMIPGTTKSVASVLDITERRRSEEALRRSEAFASLLLDSITDMITVQDTEYNVVRVNRAVEQAFGKDVVGRKCYQAYQGRDAVCPDCPSARALATGEPAFSAEQRGIGDSIFEIWAFPMKDEQGRTIAAIEYGKDISERRRAEEELKRAQEFNETVLSSMQDSISIINVADFSIIGANGSFLEHCGLKEEQVIGKTCYEITHRRSEPCAPPEHACPIMNTLTSGQPSVVEHQHFDRDGGQRYVEVSVSPLRDAEGRITRVVHVAKDITERKRSEEALREHGQQLEALHRVGMAVNQALDPRAISALALTSALNVLGMEAGVARYLDEATQELVPLTYHGFPQELLREIAARPRIPVGQGLAGRVAQTGQPVIVEDGAQQPMLTYYETVPRLGFRSYVGLPLKVEGRVVGTITGLSYQPRKFTRAELNMLGDMGNLIGTAIERARAEENLRREKDFSQTILNSASDPICIIDVRDFRLAGFNESFLQQFGLGEEEARGKTCYEVTYGRSEPCAPPHHVCLILSTLASGGTSIAEHPHRGPDGEERYVEVSVSPVRDARGNIAQVVHVARDITERKAMEDRLRELYEKERKDREELQEEAKARGQFIKVLAHELKTPLTPILASAGMLKDALSGHADSYELRLATSLHNGAQTMALRLNDLLDLAAPHIGAYSLQFRPIGPRPWLEMVALEFEPAAAQKGQRVVLDLPESLPAIEADRSRLHQVMLNLLTNASKFGPEGSSITVSADVEGGELVVAVHDEGPGITAEELERILRPYHRAEQDRQRFQGLGLGLALCKQIVEGHGGRLWLTSGPGQGTTSRFSVPLERSPSAEGRSPGP